MLKMSQNIAINGALFKKRGIPIYQTNPSISSEYEWERVDKEKCVKLYLAAIKQVASLAKSGLMMFEAVYHELRENPGKDTVPLDQMSSGLKEHTYHRGLRELLEREFIFRSTNPGLFFVNIQLMFNGDRLAFVKGYKLKKTNQIVK